MNFIFEKSPKLLNFLSNALLKNLENYSFIERMEIATLNQSSKSQDLQHMISLFATQDFNLKKETLETITAEENKEKVLPLLFNALTSEDQKIKYWAIIALGMIRDPKSVPLLIHSYRDPRPLIRRSIMEVLLEFNDQALYSFFIKALNDPDVGVKRNAVCGLGELKDKAINAIPILFKHLFDSDTRLRCEVIKSLKMIDEIFANIFTSEIFTMLYFMNDVKECKSAILQKISKYSENLKHYPELVSQAETWLKDNPIIEPREIKIKDFKLRDFKLGKFENRDLINSKDWFKRLLEEESKLEKLLNFYRETKNNFSLVRAEFDASNPRMIYCTIEFTPYKGHHPHIINFEIRIPLKYPLRPPKACNFSLYNFIARHHDFKRWDDEDPDFKDFRFACLGKLDSRWHNDGSMGIAHYIQMLCYYAAFDHFAWKFDWR